MNEGTQAIILSGHGTLKDAQEAYEKYKLPSYIMKDDPENRVKAQLISRVDEAIQRCSLRIAGSHATLFDQLSGTAQRTVWETELIRLLEPKGGFPGLHKIFNVAATPYAPLHPRDSAQPLEVETGSRMIHGEFWSKALGEPIAIFVSHQGTDLGGAVDNNRLNRKLFETTSEQVRITVFTVTDATRDEFVDRI